MQLHHNRRELEALKTRVLVIGFESAERARLWLQKEAITFPFLLDPGRSVYQAYGLERSFWRSWHPRNLWFYLKRLFGGESIPRIRADPNQLGGDFLVDTDGLVRLAYPSEDAMDRPSLEELLSLLERLER